MDWRAERGSITAVWVATLAAFFLLGLAIVEREWVNYQMQLIEQAADLAAEAGAYDHQVTVEIKATRTKTVFVASGCEPLADGRVPAPSDPDCLNPIGDWEVLTEEVPPRTDLAQNVEGEKWKELMGCDARSGWTCTKVELTNLCLEAGPRLTTTVEETFRGNWRNRRANRLIETLPVYSWTPARCSPDGVGIRVGLQVDYALRPFFGMLNMEQVLTGMGSAVIKVKPPALTL